MKTRLLRKLRREASKHFIKTVTERQVKDTFGDDYKIADFAITEITPL